jgi:putative nucleotidyltransferase with HDIG domain
MLLEDKQLDKFDQTMKAVFQPLEENGLLDLLSHDLAKGNQEKIKVYIGDKVDEAKVVEVASVRIPEVKKTLLSNLRNEIKRTFPASTSELVGSMVFNFVSEIGLPITLRYDSALSESIRKQVLEGLPAITTPYLPGESVLAAGGKPLGVAELELLKQEHNAWISQLPLSEQLIRLISFFGMLAAMYLLVGLYIYFQYDPSLVRDTGRFVRLMMLVFVVCWGCWCAANDAWRAEVIPIVICAITATIAYGRPFALVLLTTMIITITLALGQGSDSLVVLGAAACSAILFLGRIRSRTRLIYVGFGTAAITATTLLGVGVMVGQTVDMVPGLGTNSISGSMILGLLTQLVAEAGRHAIYVMTACLLMTGLLPIVERLFGVQTDLSLLELGDTAHPLLRQLAQRAPGTFNHSINVAAIAEPAAESIGGNGLLTRVGAYFHDIGKMFKPTYFVENQSGGNRHDSLQPAMSTLVIIAHVKDGADLARQYRLPQPIIDFIEQHHGTTLVEYFFRQATKKSEEDPNGEEVSEHGFRYPGPKPQSLEAAVLMLADAVESASRTLVEPTSARLQNLVNDIATKRLLDGQFEECGMTLSQLGLVKQSLVKSLTAIYHGRLKYPGQQTA